MLQRWVLLAVAAGVIIVGSLVVAVAVPRYSCSERTRLFEVPEEWPQDVEFGCEEINPPLTPGWDEADDRFPVKVGIAAGGVLLGGLLATLALVGERRRSAGG